MPAGCAGSKGGRGQRNFAIGRLLSAFAGKDTTHHHNYGSYELAKCIVQGIKDSRGWSVEVESPAMNSVWTLSSFR